MEWTLANHLGAAAIDELRVANWQRGNAGAKKPSPPPDPIIRPGVTARRTSVGDSMSLPDLRARIEELRTAPTKPPSRPRKRARKGVSDVH